MVSGPSHNKIQVDELSAIGIYIPFFETKSRIMLAYAVIIIAADYAQNYAVIIFASPYTMH